MSVLAKLKYRFHATRMGAKLAGLPFEIGELDMLKVLLTACSACGAARDDKSHVALKETMLGYVPGNLRRLCTDCYKKL